jgi:4-hydroxy-2-oxoheptanedioate aldolase
MADRAARGAYFHPKGARGVQPFVRAASYRSYPTAEFFGRSNDDIVLVHHIEGERGIENLDEILAVEGFDVAFIGPYDLSQSLGIPGQVKHPRVRARMSEALEKARDAGKVVGTYCDDVETAQEWRALGVRYITVSLDAGIFLSSARRIVDSLRS